MLDKKRQKSVKSIISLVATGIVAIPVLMLLIPLMLLLISLNNWHKSKVNYGD